MKIRANIVGAFIDAVYAIAVTILALEIPDAAAEETFKLRTFSAILLEYALAFVLLFSFWLQHRRINELTEFVSRGALWTTAAVLILVCLVPPATTLIFEHGDDVTLGALDATLFGGAGWTTAEAVDLLYVVIVVSIDLGILALLRVNRALTQSADIGRLQRFKILMTLLLVLVACTSFLLPIENRYFLLVMPALLFFEGPLSRWVERPGGAR